MEKNTGIGLFGYPDLIFGNLTEIGLLVGSDLILGKNKRMNLLADPDLMLGKIPRLVHGVIHANGVRLASLGLGRRSIRQP